MNVPARNAAAEISDVRSTVNQRSLPVNSVCEAVRLPSITAMMMAEEISDLLKAGRSWLYISMGDNWDLEKCVLETIRLFVARPYPRNIYGLQ
jgi:hypothetical protein